MAASLIQNAIQVFFNSVLSMEDEGMTEKQKETEKEMEKEKQNEKEKEKKTEKEAADKRKQVEKIIDSEDTEPLSKVLDLTETSLSDEESMSIDDILRQIPEKMMLPSVLAEDTTKIRFGHGIAFREENWYKASLPQIDADDKGKEPLVEEINKGNPAKEMFSLICAYIDFLVQLREEVIEEISSFFQSSPLVSFEINFKFGNKGRADAHRSSLKFLLEQMRQHKLEWTRPCNSELFGREMYRVVQIFRDFILASSLLAGVMKKRGKWRVVEDRSLLKKESDLEMEEEVEVATVNLQRKEVVDCTDQEVVAGVRAGIVGLDEQS
ncbi:hypothetical protein F511_07239 [Dorcoceras hygrometricum]|uniref:Uncharacterized protein n=1 Tax=Dorcoceras hygrometricum TaxID=472368 RepID=A0A2Z7AQN0_9LAMI|nr:hypothetical protein F511_07239 [Dorcoceras hygrometricum]